MFDMPGCGSLLRRARERSSGADSLPAAKGEADTGCSETNLLHSEQEGRWLIEQRSSTGRWAGMWQFVTIDPQQNGTAGLPCVITKPKLIGHIAHTLTHRQYNFEVFTCNAKSENLPTDEAARNWVTLDTLDNFPLPVPHFADRSDYYDGIRRFVVRFWT